MGLQAADTVWRLDFQQSTPESGEREEVGTIPIMLEAITLENERGDGRVANVKGQSPGGDAVRHSVYFKEHWKEKRENSSESYVQGMTAIWREGSH